MTPAAHRILQELAGDDRRDLIRDGIHAYCGARPVASRVVSELIWCSAVRPLMPDDGLGGAKYYTISEMGRAYLRRPELEIEYRRAIMTGKGSFTIRNDRIVPI